MEIKILGSGCPNCIKLAKNVEQALKELSVEAKIVKVTDYAEITSYGVMSTPALVLNNKVVMSGKVANVEQIKEYLK